MEAALHVCDCRCGEIGAKPNVGLSSAVTSSSKAVAVVVSVSFMD